MNERNIIEGWMMDFVMNHFLSIMVLKFTINSVTVLGNRLCRVFAYYYQRFIGT